MRETTLSAAMRKEMEKVDPVTGKTNRQLLMDELRRAAAEPTALGKRAGRELRKWQADEAAERKTDEAVTREIARRRAAVR
jgi:hypothetical protein